MAGEDINVRASNSRTRHERRVAQWRDYRAANTAAINARRKNGRHARRDQLNSIRRKRRTDIIRARRQRFDNIFGIVNDGALLQDIVQNRISALEEARRDMGVTIQMTDPCVHCGAKLFAKESKGICCKNGKFVLPRLPPLPPLLSELYQSSEPSAQKFRKDARMYNCRCNFASLNVEDGELKKMFGDHLLSVQGRTYHSVRDGQHSNVRWLLHDPNYVSDHLDKDVMEKIRDSLRSTSPYIDCLHTAMDFRTTCDATSFSPLSPRRTWGRRSHQLRFTRPCCPGTSDKVGQHVHHDYDVIPTLFTVVPADGAEDVGFSTAGGAIFGSALSIGTQVLEEIIRCDGEAYVNADRQKLRSSFLLDTTYLAAIEKKRWFNQTRWGYNIVAMTSDDDVVKRALAFTNETIDLSGEGSSDGFKRKRGASSSQAKKRRSTQPTDDNGISDSDIDDVDDHEDNDEYVPENEHISSDEDPTRNPTRPPTRTPTRAPTRTPTRTPTAPGATTTATSDCLFSKNPLIFFLRWFSFFGVFHGTAFFLLCLCICICS